MSKTQKPLRARNKHSREKRAQKRAQAEGRQAAYDKLTLAEKLAKLGSAETNPARKQRTKLTRLLQVQNEQKAMAAPAAKKTKKKIAA